MPPSQRVRGKKPILSAAADQDPPLPPPPEPPPSPEPGGPRAWWFTCSSPPSHKKPCLVLLASVGSLRLLRKRGESPPVEIFEDC